MSRKEEIKQAAKQRFGEDSQYTIAKVQAFVIGAKWADNHPIQNEEELKARSQLAQEQTMFLDDQKKAWLQRREKEIIEKACRWLSLNMKDVNYFGMNGILHKPGFISRFKKEMEGSDGKD